MEQGNGLLSLGNPKALNFSSDGGAQAVWKGSVTRTEASVGSGSSAIVSASGDDGSEQKQSTSDLKEHDYIGLADVSSSVKPSHDTPSPKGLSLPETDLHLGLGLGLGLGPAKKTNPTEESEKTLAFTLTQKDGAPKAAMETPRYAFTEAAQAMQKTWPNAGHLRPITAENLTSARDFQAPKACMHVQDYGEGTSRVGGNTFYGGHSAALKNGTKRGYMEAMNEAARFNAVTEVRAAAAVSVKNGDGDAKVLPKHQQGAFMPNWVPAKPAVPAHWQGGLEQSSVHSFGPNKSSPLITPPRGEKPAADLTHSAYKPHDPSSEAGKESATDEPPPPKGQAVGWPPIRSYRKHTLAKPTEMFVKVNMDGMTVGRKVDLNAHSSYAGLLLALEEMFQPSNNGGQGISQSASGRDNNITDVKQLRLLNGSDFVLTYEDQDGDLMLVGDLPWSMFVNMVRRLHITRGSEAIGLAPRRPDIIK